MLMSFKFIVAETAGLMFEVKSLCNTDVHNMMHVDHSISNFLFYICMNKTIS